MMIISSLFDVVGPAYKSTTLAITEAFLGDILVDYRLPK